MQASYVIFAVVGVVSLGLPSLGGVANVHVRTLEGPALHAEEGFLLGNGDLSCSIYQTANDLVFRLGKCDVWDRRLDYSKQPKPATIDEIIDGVLNCGWKVSGWNASNLEEMKKMPKSERLLEITHGTSALRTAPYPTPKPTGEMRFRLPLDFGNPVRSIQKLYIEEGRATVELSWMNGVVIVFEAVIDPDLNVLAVEWQVKNWSEDVRISDTPPVYVAVHRWADPDWNEWVFREVGEYPSYPGKPKEKNIRPDITPLPAPVVVADNKIEQHFHPEKTFPKGFAYRMTLDPLESCGSFWRPTMPKGGKDAYFTLQGGSRTLRGAVALAVTTSRDKTLEAPKPKTFAQYKAAAKAAGEAYWSKSGFSMPGDKFIEDMWYMTYHARRCIIKAGAMPPGLFFPSALTDYSRWNGDYHANYNFHSIFWGEFTANHPEQAESYMDGVEYSVPVGRKIAKDYYNCRGVFFQLQQFPIVTDEDYNGTLPLGRMAYMTGWMMTKYWEYYMYMRDKAWLAKRGYPLIRDCALFYLDFLKKAPHPQLPRELKDGKYHAFPSVAGESGWKDPMGLCDKGQVLMHARFSLYAAIEASKVLGLDADLRAQWQDRLDNLYNSGTKDMTPYQKHCYLCCPPENGSHPVYKPSKAWDGMPQKKGHHSWDYLGILHWGHIGHVRGNDCVPERDFTGYREDIKRWTHPNGLVGAMPVRRQGRTGQWTESLSCLAPIQEMILQSWDGAIRLFPRWPKDREVAVRSWRAQGAFLVDAEWKNGKVGAVRIVSEKGEDCLVWGDWKVTDAAGQPVATDRDEFGRLRFKTKPSAVYNISTTI